MGLDDNSEGFSSSNPDSSALTRVFLNASRLIKGGNLPPSEFPIRGTPDGRIDFETSSQLMFAQENLPLSEASVGDLVWWIDEEEHKGQLLITEEYKEREEGKGMPEVGKGALRIETPDGLIDVHNASVWGASFGTSLWRDKIAKNIPVMYALPENNQGPHSGAYITGPVTNMGLIKKDVLGIDDEALEEAKKRKIIPEKVILSSRDLLAQEYYDSLEQRGVNSDQLMAELLQLSVKKVRKNLAGHAASRGNKEFPVTWDPQYYLEQGRPMVALWTDFHSDNYGAVALKYGMQHSQVFERRDHPEKNVHVVPYIHFQKTDKGPVHAVTLLMLGQEEYKDIEEQLKKLDSPQEKEENRS